MKDCCVVIIGWKPKLDYYERKSLAQGVRIFSKNWDTYIAMPANIDTKEYDKYLGKVQYKKLNPSYFRSYSSYNKMCKTAKFYKEFSEYKYMLIYQLDAWVFYDNLQHFIDLDCDWCGAPVLNIPTKEYFQNGGFNLRKISKMIELSQKYQNTDEQYGIEDIWYSLVHKDELKVCDMKEACNFVLGDIVEYINNDYGIPMGLHSKGTHFLWGKIDDVKSFVEEGKKYNKINRRLLNLVK